MQQQELLSDRSNGISIKEMNNFVEDSTGSKEDGFNGHATCTIQSSPRNYEDPLVKRVRRLCQLEMSKDLADTLTDFQTVIKSSKVAYSRIDLSSELDCRILNQQKTFRTEMKQLIQNVETQYDQIAAVHGILENKIEQLKELKRRSGKFMENARFLDVEMRNTDLKMQVLRNFTGKFSLSPEEIEDLSFSDRKLDNKFFEALGRSQKIHDDSKILLRLQPTTQIMGLQLMEAAAEYQEKGFQRLYRWCMEETRKLSTDSQVFIPFHCLALGLLQQRPTLLKTVLDEYASVRKSFVTGAFVDALTQGTATGSRPLELNSYDTLRYSTDILGWLHQTIALEKDYWLSLTKDIPDELKNDHTVRVFSTLTEGIIRPLKTRFVRIIEVEQNPIVLYKIRHWINFYIDKMRKSIDEDIPVLTTLSEISEAIYSRYLFNLKNIVVQMAKKIDVPPENLEPSPGLTSVLAVLQELILCQESLSGSDGNEDALTTVMGIVMEPLLSCITESAAHVSPNTSNATAVYLVNCLHMIKSMLFSEDSNDLRSEFLNRQCDAHIDSLINSTTAHVINETRMRPLLDLLRSSEMPVEELPDIFFDEFLISFDHYLANPDQFNLRELHFMICPRSRNRVTQTSKKLMGDFYEQIRPILLSSKYANRVKSFDVVSRLISP